MRTPGALALLRDAKRVALICHMAPDSDCVGGMMALTHSLRAQGKEVHPLSPDPIPDHLLHVPGAPDVPAAVQRLPDVDLILTVECASLERTEPIYSNAREQLERLPILNVDHHVSNTGYGTERVFEPHAASVCEVLFRVLRDVEAPMDEKVAYCLLTGIIGDTRSFRTSSTTADTLRIAGELIAIGAPLNQVADNVAKHRVAREVALWGEVLGRAKTEDGILWTTITDEDARRHGLALEQVDGIVEFLSDTRDIHVAAVFKVSAPDKVRVSLRSDGTVDVARLIARWGGGGHPPAAGTTVAGVPPAQVEAEIVAALKDALAAR